MGNTFDQQKAGRVPKLKEAGQFRFRNGVGDGEQSRSLSFTLTHGKPYIRIIVLFFNVNKILINLNHLQRLNTYLAFSGGVHSN